MKTFTKIERLLEEYDRQQNFQSKMLEGGCVGRTKPGTRMFMNSLAGNTRISQQLSEYPWQWIKAVQTIKSLRK